ncbi:Predicted nucleotidyltransferase [Thermodesulforhabdus norvegica]|uniref:Predicted nucleotidyltransferase n=1 Tax=Thermodesulforhabdus norvegica TaxID=39841 RepID=A0A1I4TVY7_9BACT|nr:Predicted nucleotidyltransferase [Thermodesulforhabdus norvegica]
MECGAKKVLLFGSVARGEERPGSDVDLACEGLPPERFFEALGKLLLSTGKDVDLIDLDKAKGPLCKRIEKEGVSLYEAK